MTEEQIALARRAVACTGWWWSPGMLAVRVEAPPFVSEGCDVSKMLNREHRVFGVNKAKLVCCDREAFASKSTAALPDLTDPATLGCLLALVRKTWGDPGFYAALSDIRIKNTDILGWDFYGHLHGKSCKGMLYRSEAESLVAALEAAPSQ